MTLKETALAIGKKDPNMIKNFEINGRLPRLEYFARLVIALDTTFEALLG
jgi:hypothetical protein